MNERDIAALKADWTQFCDQNAKDDWAALAARIAAPAPKKSARRWIFATSLVAAAAAIMLVCLPILNAWRSVTADKNNSGDAPMSPDDGHYENMDGVFDASTTAPSRGEDINYGGEHGSDKNNGNGDNGNANGGTPSTTVATAPTENNAAVGGGYGGSYVYVNGEKHLGENLFSYYLYENFTEDDTKELNAEIAAEINGTHYAYTGASLQRRILALNIPREKIEEINESSKKMYAGHKQYDRLVFTDEEINDMYTLTREEYNQKYKAPTAAIIGAVLYPFNWFVENPVEIWMQHPFTLEQIEEVFENGKKANFPEKYLDEFEKKLSDYIAALAM